MRQFIHQEFGVPQGDLETVRLTSESRQKYQAFFYLAGKLCMRRIMPLLFNVESYCTVEGSLSFFSLAFSKILSKTAFTTRSQRTAWNW